MINTWKRNDLLRQSVAHYATCAGVDSIHVVWSEPDLPQSSLIDSLKRLVRSKSKGGREIEIKFNVNKEDSLNNRFKEIRDLRTDAIYSIDDDVITPCSSLEFAYTVWNSAPSSMVGFVPRMHWLRNPTVYMIPFHLYVLLFVAFVTVLFHYFLVLSINLNTKCHNNCILIMLTCTEKYRLVCYCI